MSPGLRRGTRADPDSAVLRRILASPIESTAIVGQASSRIAVAACATRVRFTRSAPASSTRCSTGAANWPCRPSRTAVRRAVFHATNRPSNAWDLKASEDLLWEQLQEGDLSLDIIIYETNGGILPRYAAKQGPVS